MKLSDIARVARGVVTGNSAFYIMTRAEARNRGIEMFVKPVMGGAGSFPKIGLPVVHDTPERDVILIATQREVEDFPALHKYLGDRSPKLASVRIAPIAASYVGVPHFVANPDGLVITNSLYTITPRISMNKKETLELVQQLNAAMAMLQKPRFAARYTPRSLEVMEIQIPLLKG